MNVKPDCQGRRLSPATGLIQLQVEGQAAYICLTTRLIQVEA